MRTRARSRARPIACPECGSRAVPRRYESAEHQRATSGYFECGRWDAEAGSYVDGCGWVEDVATVRRERPELLDDGRIRSPEDVPARIAGARARRASDPFCIVRPALSAQHEVYCAEVDRTGWVEILAADQWTERRLAEAGVRIGRTQVRRNRLYLTERGYLRRLEHPSMSSLKLLVQDYKAAKRTPPTILEVCKAPREDT